MQREFRRALFRSEEFPEGYIHTIPIKLDDCTVPHRFSRHQWANLHDEGAFDRIIRALHYGLQQLGKPLPELPGGHVPPAWQFQPDAPEASTVASPSPAMSQPLSSFMNSIGMELILIPAGFFMMGTSREQFDALGEDDRSYCIEYETLQHRVEISEPFYLGTYPVTQSQWKAVMGTNPSRFSDHPNRPVENVTWHNVQVFIEELNVREGHSLYRLPTEAEWEYACRAGSKTVYCFGDGQGQLSAYAWYKQNAEGTTHPVGQLQPNTWGLYDMHGNVWEWVQDWYAEDYYKYKLGYDPRGYTLLGGRVLRGGSWFDDGRSARSATRVLTGLLTRNDNIGFRLARDQASSR